MPLDPEALVNESVQIASLPSIFYEIDSAVEDPESSFSEIAQIISRDVALSARLLKIVNSSFFGFSSRIETITHAITIVGLAQLRDLVLATTVVSQFRGVPQEVVNMERFWSHSIACGLAARIIAIYRREPNAERYYVKGILHDVGRLILFLNLPDKMKEAFSLYENDGGLLYEAERKVLGFDHSEVGGALIQTWNLPPTLQETVRYHHNPSKAPQDPTSASIIHLADIIAHAMQLGTSGERWVPPLDAKVWGKINLPSHLIGSIVDQVDRQFVEASQMFQAS
ncbi:MAG: phosphohydrolase [Nitrospinae bacterium CG11_big_fil_rev_8_21_14_0_20_56_8]|nr:MAG: phosphohydrolase [Nitrospinae bacterium CG11_big_fil_rev_8_21_14_0_20_56_8]